MGHSQNYTIFTTFDSSQTVQSGFDAQGTAILLIVFVILFCCVVCFCVPLYIKRWLRPRVQRIMGKEPNEGVGGSVAQFSVSPQAKDVNEMQDFDIENMKYMEAIKDVILKEAKPATHRRALSSSMMQRIIYNVHNIDKNDSDLDANENYNQDTIRTTIQCVSIHNNGELEMQHSPSHNSPHSPASEPSEPSQNLLLELPIHNFASNKAQKSKSHGSVSTMNELPSPQKSKSNGSNISDPTVESNELQLPQLGTSHGSNLSNTNTLNSTDFPKCLPVISMMSPSNFSPPTNHSREQLEALTVNELELLYTESEVNHKLNGDIYVD